MFFVIKVLLNVSLSFYLKANLDSDQTEAELKMKEDISKNPPVDGADKTTSSHKGESGDHTVLSA